MLDPKRLDQGFAGESVGAVEAKNGPKPLETRVPPDPTLTRAMRGPTEVRTAWVETRTLIPGTPTRKPKATRRTPACSDVPTERSDRARVASAGVVIAPDRVTAAEGERASARAADGASASDPLGQVHSARDHHPHILAKDDLAAGGGDHART